MKLSEALEVRDFLCCPGRWSPLNYFQNFNALISRLILHKQGPDFDQSSIINCTLVALDARRSVSSLDEVLTFDASTLLLYSYTR